MAVVFDNCYGCVQLRIGCLLIGYAKLILTVIVIKVSIVGVMYGDLMLRLSSKAHVALIINALTTVTISSLVLVLSSFQLVFLIVLLVGIHQDKRGHVKAYLIYDTVLLLLFTIGSVLHIMFVTITLNWICGWLIVFSIAVYNFMVIRSYYIRTGPDVTGQDLKPDKGHSLP